MMNTRRLPLVLLAALLVATLFAPAAGAADPVQTAIQSAIQWLHTQQLPDGSFGGSNKQPSAAVTSDVVYALALAGEDVDGPEWTRGGVSALDALANMAQSYIGTDAGQAGKVARAAAAAGANPRSFGGMDVIAVIEATYDPATGRYHPSFLFRQTLAMEGLRVSGEPIPAKAHQALRDAQLPDGGWFWSFAGTEADIDTTGRVLQILGAEPQGKCDVILAGGARYLARTQRADGAWVDAPARATVSNSNSTALAVAGFKAVGLNPGSAALTKGGRTAVEALLAFQEPSGAFRYTMEPGREESRIAATTDALLGLLEPMGTADVCLPPYLPLIVRHLIEGGI